MKKLMFQGIALIICVFSASAATVDFEAQIQPIFTSNCVRCHGSAAGLSLDKGVSYNNLVGVVSHNYPPAVRVKPGDLANSVLFNKVNDTGVYGGVMPKDTGKMSGAYIDLIASWIAPTPVPTACTATVDNSLSLHIPYLSYVISSITFYLWTDFTLEFNPIYPELLHFKLKAADFLINPVVTCSASTLSNELKIHIPDLLLPDGVSHYWVDLEYDPVYSTGDNFYWVVKAIGIVSN